MVAAAVEAARLVVRLTLDSSQFTRDATNAEGIVGRLGQSFQRGIALGLGYDAVSEVLRGVSSAAKAVDDAIIGVNASLEQSQLKFQALTGSADEAKQLITQLESVASNSTFGLQQLSAGASQLLAFGTNAKNVVPLIQDIQTAAAASGGDIVDKFNRINYVIGELNSGMPVSARQLRQLATAGVPLTAIADALGTTTAKLFETGKTGEFTSAQIVAAFDKVYAQGKLGDFMQQQTQTFSGALEVIKTNLQLAGAQAFKPVFDAIRDLAVEIGNFVRSPEFAEWSAFVQESVINVISTIDELITKLKPLGDAFKAAFSQFSQGNIGGGFDALTKPFKDAFVDITNQITGFTSGMASAGENVVVQFAQGMVNGVGTALNTATTYIAQFIADFFIGHSPPPNGPLSQILAGGQTLIETYAQGMYQGVTPVEAVAKEVDNILSNIGKDGGFDAAKQSIADAAGNLDAMKAAGDRVADTIRTIQHAIDDLATVMAGVTLQMDEIKQSYVDPINNIDQQIEKVKRDNSPDLARKQLELNLQQQITGVNLEKANADVNAPDYDAQIRDLQKKLADAGNNTTTLVDSQIKATQDAITDLRDGVNSVGALNDQINALKQSVANPKSDVQETQINDLMKERANAGAAEKAMIDSKLNGLRSQYVVQKQADDDKKVAVDAEVQRLETIKAEQTLVDNEKNRNLALQLRSLQDQKSTIEEGNRVAKQGYTDQIRNLQDAKANQDAQYDSELKRLTAQDNIYQLQDKQLDLNKQILLLPLDQAKQDLLDKEKAQLDPLQKQLDIYKLQSEELSLIKKQWDALKSDAAGQITDLGSKKGSKDGGPQVILPDRPTEDPAITAQKEKFKQMGKDAADQFAKGVEEWLTQNKDNIIAGGIGAVIGGAIFGPLGAIAGGIFAEKLFGKIKEIISGSKMPAQQTGTADLVPDAPAPDGLMKTVELIKSQFQAFSDWAEQHPTVLKAWILAIAAALSALVIAANPVAAIFIGAGGIIALFEYDYATNSSFKTFVDDFVKNIQRITDAAGTALDALGRFNDWLSQQSDKGATGFIGPIPNSGDPGNFSNQSADQSAEAHIQYGLNGTYRINGGPWLKVGSGGRAVPANDNSNTGVGSPNSITPEGLDPSLTGSQNVRNTDVGGWIKDTVGAFFDKLGTFGNWAVQGEGSSSHRTQPVDAASGNPDDMQGQLDAFVQHIKDQLGDGNGATQAVQDFLDTVSKLQGSEGFDQALSDAETQITQKFGLDGTVPKAFQDTDQSVKDTTTTFNDNLGDGKSAQTSIQEFSDRANRAFGRGKDLDNLIGSNGALKGTLDDARQQFDTQFGAQGIQNPITNFKTFVDGIFSQGNGSLATLFGSDAQAVLMSLLKMYEDSLGTDGKGARASFSGFGTFIQNLFQAGGPLAQYVAAFGPVLDGAMPGDVAPMSGFVKSVGDAIHTIGNIFKIPEMSDFQVPTISYSSSRDAGQQNYAKGVFNSPEEGHWATVGENGPEPMFVPKGSTILPNHIGKALGMLPGHANGYNVDAFMLPGPWQGLATSLTKTVNDSIAALLTKLGPARHGGGIPGGGFQTMALDAYMAYMAQYGGPLDNESAFNDLIGVGREKGVDPRWFMAIMQTEDGFGTAAGDQLPQYNNYGGMGVRVPGLGFPSPIYATDGGPQPYAAFNSFHDFLEDEADWIRENGTSFAGYQTADAGQGKNAAFAAILGAIPDIGGPALGPFNNVAGGWPDVVNAAMGMLNDPELNGPNWNGLCEKFAEQAERNGGFDEAYWATAAAHAYGVDHNSGWGPPGSMQHWGTGYWPVYGHAAINLDGNGMVIGTSPNGIAQYSMAGATDNIGWIPPGLAQGGVAYDPTTVRIGDIPGRIPEIVAPQPMMKDTVKQALAEAGGTGTTVNVYVTINADRQTNVKEIESIVVTQVPKVLKQAMADIGR